MAAGFSLKKIKPIETLGSKFKKSRKRMKVSLVDAEMEIKIRAKYLEALENDNWIDLPADAYAKGFVIRYAKFLGLNPEKSYEQYKHERAIYYHASDDVILPKKSVKETGFALTPKFVIPTVVGLFVAAIFGYIIFQVYGFAAAPELQITNLDNNSVLENEEIEIKGITDQNAKVSVNDENVAVSTEGKFIADYRLVKGINVIQIKSANKAQKEKSLTYTVEYRPKTAQVGSENQISY